MQQELLMALRRPQDAVRVHVEIARSEVIERPSRSPR
jgi:hypothetical protein